MQCKSCGTAAAFGASGWDLPPPDYIVRSFSGNISFCRLLFWSDRSSSASWTFYSGTNIEHYDNISIERGIQKCSRSIQDKLIFSLFLFRSNIGKFFWKQSRKTKKIWLIRFTELLSHGEMLEMLSFFTKEIFVAWNWNYKNIDNSCLVW